MRKEPLIMNSYVIFGKINETIKKVNEVSEWNKNNILEEFN